VDALAQRGRIWLGGWCRGDPHRRPGADPHDEIRVPAPAAATWPSRHAARNPRESLSVPVVVVVA